MGKAKKHSRRVLDHVSQPEIERALDFVCAVAELLRLPGWKVGVSVKTSDSCDAAASIRTISGRYCASLALNSQWETYGLDERREILTHEALHLAHHRVDDAVNATEGSMPSRVHDQLASAIDLELEYVVDLLSYALADWPPVREAFDRIYDGVADPA